MKPHFVRRMILASKATRARKVHQVSVKSLCHGCYDCSKLPKRVLGLCRECIETFKARDAMEQGRMSVLAHFKLCTRES